MLRKKLLVAGMAAAMTISTGITANAAPQMNGNSVDFIRTADVQGDSQQATRDDSMNIDPEFGQDADQNNGQVPNRNNGQAPNQNNGQAPDQNMGQAPNQNDGQAPDQNSGQAPSGEAGQPGRKSDEEAMKEGNPTPELPEGVTAEKPDDLPDGTTAPDGSNGQVPSGDASQAPSGDAGQPGRKSDEEAMKEGNPKPELPAGVILEGDGSDL